MSSITRMVIYARFGEEQAMERLNKWCRENSDHNQQFEGLDLSYAGGAKAFAGQVWAIAGNYFPYEQLVELFASFGWQDPASVVLIVDDSHTERVDVRRAITP